MSDERFDACSVCGHSREHHQLVSTPLGLKHRCKRCEYLLENGGSRVQYALAAGPDHAFKRVELKVRYEATS